MTQREGGRECASAHEPSYESNVRLNQSEEQEDKRKETEQREEEEVAVVVEEEEEVAVVVKLPKKKKRMMRSFQVQSQVGSWISAQTQSSSSSASMSPVIPLSFILTALLVLCVPGATSAPVELYQTTTAQRQLLRQIDTMCSSFLPADLKMWASDVLGELCVLMLVQKSKELKVRESSKRAELQGPGGIQSRGYFLYRPRNGRRSLEYE